MSAKKTINASVNLPVESIQTIIDVNDKRVEVNIDEVMKKMKGKSDESIQSMNTTIVVEYDDLEKKKIGRIIYEHDTFNIESIERKKIEKTNDIKFYNVRIELNTGIVKKFIVPSYVKFYSSQRGIFIPVEYVRNRDILLDYTGNIVKIDDTELNESFKMTDFYSINTKYEIDESPDLNESMKLLNECNFYLNGILTNISYNNFQKKED